MFRQPLTESQIEATLSRHGYPAETQVIGIRYGDITTVNVQGAQLIVPTDVLRARSATDLDRVGAGRLFRSEE